MGIRISEMEEATTFGADDYVPIVTNGTNKKALGSKIKDFIAGFFATKTGDNISDKATFRSAIEISATNTPFDKTGTGMSAENVQAAIAELSGNRALIDGSNIANPSTFRQSIGLNVTSGTLTNLDSHVYYSEIKKTANQVILYVEMYNFTNQTETIVASIPEAFRPSHRIMFDCLVLSPNVDALRGYARGSVTAAGNITYQNLGNYANGFASFTLTWFI